MKILKIIGVVVLVIVVLFLSVVAFQPAKGHIERSIVINAPPSAVFVQVNSFKTFKDWSPWAKMDPDATYTFEGPPSGQGCKMSWSGKKTGKGSQWIAESEENKRVKSGLSFEGFDGTAFAEFTLSPEGSGTKLSWTYDGDNSGLGGKAMWMFMKPMLGGQYDQGLNDLKKLIESSPMPTDTTTQK